MIIAFLSLVIAQTPLQSYSAAFIEQSRRTDPQIDYTVTLPPSKTAYVLELRIHNAPNPSRLVIPNWAPRAYRLMNAGANISGFAAFTDDGRGGGGTPLFFTQESPNPPGGRTTSATSITGPPATD